MRAGIDSLSRVRAASRNQPIAPIARPLREALGGTLPALRIRMSPDAVGNLFKPRADFITIIAESNFRYIHGPERLHGVFSVLVSSISPEAILPTMTAAPITSAGRFSPGGPRGIFRLFLCCFCETVIVLCHLKQLVLGVYETEFVRPDRASLAHVSDSTRDHQGT